jgi:hypothetical protein
MCEFREIEKIGATLQLTMKTFFLKYTSEIKLTLFVKQVKLRRNGVSFMTKF